jgi:hypothetical protein
VALSDIGKSIRSAIGRHDYRAALQCCRQAQDGDTVRVELERLIIEEFARPNLGSAHIYASLIDELGPSRLIERPTIVSSGTAKIEASARARGGRRPSHKLLFDPFPAGNTSVYPGGPCIEEVARSRSLEQNRAAGADVLSGRQLSFETLSPSWSGAEVCSKFHQSSIGVVVIDDFLQESVLYELHRLLSDPQIWNQRHYKHGRVGAFIRDGILNPLLLRICMDLIAKLDGLVGSYPLRKIWGFRSTTPLSREVTNHADSAAINVNLWLTPDVCNLAPSTGGMTIYDVKAPADWTFDQYNSSPERIRSYITRNSKDVLDIPYRQNRAVIFDSDLFHGTDNVLFGEDWKDHRINVTALFGDRGSYRRSSAWPGGSLSKATTPAWKSRCWSRR